MLELTRALPTRFPQLIITLIWHLS